MVSSPCPAPGACRRQTALPWRVLQARPGQRGSSCFRGRTRLLRRQIDGSQITAVRGSPAPTQASRRHRRRPRAADEGGERNRRSDSCLRRTPRSRSTGTRSGSRSTSASRPDQGLQARGAEAQVGGDRPGRGRLDRPELEDRPTMGKPLTLVNSATGKRYTLRLLTREASRRPSRSSRRRVTARLRKPGRG